MARFIRLLIVLLAIALVIAATAFVVIRGRGFSARGTPGRVETTLARAARRLAIPDDSRQRRSPTPPTAADIRSGLEHYADHCATCHANDGSGDAEVGRGLYPKPPDMRLEPTQSLTDGELFYVIENGVPLTGMPGWGTGTAEGETASWHLVHFIRQLPKLSDADLEEMAGLNPRSADEWRQDEEARKFLEGAVEAPRAPTPSHTHGGHP